MTLVSELTSDDEALLVRTNLRDEARWRGLVRLVMQPRASEGSRDDQVASVSVVEDPLCALVGPREVSAILGRAGWWGLVFLQMASDPEGRLLTFYSNEPGQQFWCPADKVAEVEASLSIDNLDLEDYQEMFSPGEILN